jgi:hypothetical protein
MLRSEAARMLTASENSENSSKYLFFLSEFPRRRIELSGLIAGPWLLAIGRASSSMVPHWTKVQYTKLRHFYI